MWGTHTGISKICTRKRKIVMKKNLATLATVGALGVHDASTTGPPGLFQKYTRGKSRILLMGVLKQRKSSMHTLAGEIFAPHLLIECTTPLGD